MSEREQEVARILHKSLLRTILEYIGAIVAMIIIPCAFVAVSWVVANS